VSRLTAAEIRDRHPVRIERLPRTDH
jgi:hypothetical protein